MVMEQIKLHTGHDENGEWKEDNKTANLVAHAILGAVVAELQGNSGLVGGASAVSGELAAKVIRDKLYNKDVKDLTEAEKQNISALTQLVIGLTIASMGGDTGDVATGIDSSKNAVENNNFGQAIVKAVKAVCKGDIACEDKIINEGINSYNETIIEYGKPQVIVIGGLIAAPIAVDVVGPAIASCSLNPILCANQVATWLIETVGFEAYPAAGLGMTAGTLANSLSKTELNDLAAIMALYKNNRIENPSTVLNEIKTTLSEDGAYKIVYDRSNNTIIKQTNAGKGTTGTSVIAQGESGLVGSKVIQPNTTVKLTENTQLPNGEVIPKGSTVTVSDNTMKVTYPDGTSKISSYDKAISSPSALPDLTNVGKGKTDLTSKYSGNLVKVNKPDPAADALAQRIGGESRVRFANDIREFDVISDLYVAQTKPALKQLNVTVRKQMKATFEAAKETNRSVYYHFEGQPAQSVINKLNEYSKRYGIKVVIDTKPLNLTK